VTQIIRPNYNIKGKPKKIIMSNSQPTKVIRDKIEKKIKKRIKKYIYRFEKNEDMKRK
jgi:hypothetical protein